MRLLRFVLIAFASFIALVVAVYLVVNLASVVSAHHQRSALSVEITDQIVEELGSSQQRVDAVADRSGVAPAHSWSSQHCEFATNDGGWIVQDYREVCSLESARAWPVDSEAEASALLDTVQPAEEPFVSGPCHITTLSGESYGDNTTALYIEPSGEAGRWCEPTDSDFEQRRAVAGEMPDLDNAQGWLVVVDTRELVDEVIGCTHWSVIFCDNPFGDELAWGDPA